MTRNGTEAPAIQHTFDTVNSAYEKWLRSECDVVTEDLKKKHKRMRKSAFDFLRATYFRWAESIESLCPDLRDAPVVLSVGDMHVENFGTWRDGDGRLVWGINDFDEAAAMPYVWDLVRLAVSADLAPPRRLTAARATQALLSGYRDGLSAPRPAVLDQDNRWIRRYVEGSARADEEFWAGIDACRSGAPPQSVQRALRRILPAHTEVVRFAARTAGGGSLGRARYVVVGQWQGALIVREAKALVPSAWQWAHGSEPAVIRFQEISNGPYRSPDPHLQVIGRYVYRRLSPDARKLDLPELAGNRLTERLLGAMGRDLGAVHAAGGSGKKILKDLDSRDAKWLKSAAKMARAHLLADFSAHVEKNAA